jgi:hypothetical protein
VDTVPGKLTDLSGCLLGDIPYACADAAADQVLCDDPKAAPSRPVIFSSSI